jgi:hypothetical protein
LGISASAVVYYNYDQSKNQNFQNEQQVSDYESDGTSINYSFRVPLSVGKGRIEPVDDARHALYILKELKKNARLTREPTDEEILVISSEISKLKNERVLDARLKKIYELKQLDSLLQSMKLVENDDINYFTTINDMWDFGGLQYRSSGTRISLEYSPMISFRNSEYKRDETDYQNSLVEYFEDKNFTTNFRNALNLYFTWEKPFKQKFQSSLYTSIGYSIEQSHAKYEEIQPNATITEDDSKANLLNGYLNYRFGYYPNTRTDFSTYVSIGTEKMWTTQTYAEQETDSESLDYRTSFGAQFNYYISPKLRLTFSHWIHLNKSSYNTDDNEIKSERINHSTSFTLKYSIF